MKELTINEIIELCRIIYNYTADSTIKYIINNAALAVVGYDCASQKIAFEDVDEKHIISSFVSYFADVVKVYAYDDDGYKVLVETEKASQYAQDYVDKLSLLIKSLEDYIAGSFEAAAEELPFDTGKMLGNIKTASENFIQLVTTSAEENGWEIDEFNKSLVSEDHGGYLLIANKIISKYNDDIRFFLSDVIRDFGLVEILFSLFGNYTGINFTEEVQEMIANMVYDSLRPNPNYDYENYIRTVCSIYGIDDETVIESYIKTFEESKTFSFLSDRFSELLEAYKSLEGDSKKSYLNQIAKEFNVTTQEASEIFEKRLGAYEELVKTLSYLENIPVNGYDFMQLIVHFNELLPLMGEGFIEEEDVRMLTQVFFQIVDIENTIKNNIRSVVEKYQVEFSQFLVEIINRIIGFTDINSVQYKEIETIINYAVSEYVKGTIDFASVMNSFFKTVNNYCEGESKILANSLGMMFMIIVGQSSDVSIDYNKLFEYVELPNDVNEIDYNELVATLWSQSTYSSIFKISNPVVQFVEEAGKVVGEIVTFDIGLDFDIVVSTFNAGIQFKFYIPLV